MHWLEVLSPLYFFLLNETPFVLSLLLLHLKLFDCICVVVLHLVLISCSKLIQHCLLLLYQVQLFLIIRVIVQMLMHFVCNEQVSLVVLNLVSLVLYVCVSGSLSHSSHLHDLCIELIWVSELIHLTNNGHLCQLCSLPYSVNRNLYQLILVIHLVLQVA